MFKIRPLNDSDYDKLCQWWSDNRFPIPPKDFLPENGKGGIMLCKQETDICAGFLYFTNSNVVWLEFIVANFDYRETDRKEAIQVLIRELCSLAERKGFKYVFTTVKNQHLIKHFKDVGFTVGSSNTTEMVLSL